MQDLIRFIVHEAVIVAAVGIFACSGVVAFLDEHLLLENTNPVYYEHFNSATIKSVATDIAENGLINLVVNSVYSQDMEQGIRIAVHADGAITLSGTNDSEDTIYVSITGNDWTLEDGGYTFSDGENGAVVSTQGCRMYLQGKNYLPDGETQYVTLVDTLYADTLSFEVDHTQYDDYLVGLAIEPGFSTEGITFCPMVIRGIEPAETYHAAPLYSPYQIAADMEDATTGSQHDCVTHYDYYVISKQDYLNLSEDDLTILDRHISNLHQGEWSLIDLCDGTGILYPDNDTHQVIYGELNAAGLMGTVYGGSELVGTR